MAETNNRRNSSEISAQARKDQLSEIMRDAVNSVLERPDVRRGPYVIDNNDIKTAVASS
ncbi:hypothetical protein LB515_20390 [Mesorhizobium sp. CA15]|uniref:hypothetical protein n=1 Tax=Mesorhizobium sp. CA15 TaxID=2876641 RepID=UPI001CD0F62D|nr:hypothetical protein [Mesorhizobium sp. CA15]MBZ9867738.1 hypothetical protein [Mesorhizobium sp. CA15]